MIGLLRSLSYAGSVGLVLALLYVAYQKSIDHQISWLVGLWALGAVLLVTCADSLAQVLEDEKKV